VKKLEGGFEGGGGVSFSDWKRDYGRGKKSNRGEGAHESKTVRQGWGKDAGWGLKREKKRGGLF